MNAAETPRTPRKTFNHRSHGGPQDNEKVTVVVHTKTQPLELICMEI